MKQCPDCKKPHPTSADAPPAADPQPRLDWQSRAAGEKDID
jgi:hypothetical protein